ncbi:hypothetical protein Cgig2_027960 [Carnegiea gigantea]|uniref:Uncharacterized protein n=1 Tax=Carnegiea gigantea TaxID=171969 RepID=A0A9Q1JVV0_9CARY|nr:hypothetical protein Cgig2_027960 [Carnegiea gigantea]
MVVTLGPGKFYGSSLPRPRIYNDVKFNEERVDPPVPVLDPLLSWANEAHWSMGGLSFKRLRLQGKIEGNVQKLKKEKEKEKIEKNSNQRLAPISESKKQSSTNGGSKGKERGNREDSPQPPPISKKAQRRSMLVDGDNNDVAGEERENVRRKRRRLVRKLGDDFEMVATQNGVSQEGRSEGVASRTRSRRSMVLAEEDEEPEDGVSVGNLVMGVTLRKSVKEKRSVSPKRVSKKNGEKGSASPSNGTRSSPRLKCVKSIQACPQPRLKPKPADLGLTG